MFDPNTFSVADVQFYKNLGFTEENLIDLYHEDVTKVSEITPKLEGPMYLL